MSLKESIEYEQDARSMYEWLESSSVSTESLLSEIELLWYSRYGIKEKSVKKVDRAYLPAIYKRIKSKKPELAEYFRAKMISAGVKESIF